MKTGHPQYPSLALLHGLSHQPMSDGGQRPAHCAACLPLSIGGGGGHRWVVCRDTLDTASIPSATVRGTGSRILPGTSAALSIEQCRRLVLHSARLEIIATASVCTHVRRRSLRPLSRPASCISAAPGRLCSTGCTRGTTRAFSGCASRTPIASAPPRPPSMPSSTASNGSASTGTTISSSSSPALARHAEVARQLLAEGKAYHCYCTPEELQAMREEQQAKGPAAAL